MDHKDDLQSVIAPAEMQHINENLLLNSEIVTAADLKKAPASAKDKAWYDLGCQIGELEKRIRRFFIIMQSNFGKSNKYVKLLLRFDDNLLCGLQSDLDDIVQAAYPRSVSMLPGYDGISLQQIFYYLNRYSCEEENDFITHETPLPKKLSECDIVDFQDSIAWITTFIDKLDQTWFTNENKNISKMRSILLELQSFIEYENRVMSRNKRQKHE